MEPVFFFAFVHLCDQKADCFIGNFINLLSHRTDRDNGLSGNGGVIEADDQVILWQTTVFQKEEV